MSVLVDFTSSPFSGNYIQSGAVLSDCGTYRYRLWRLWKTGVGIAVFVMLNPSTADAGQDDPTIRKCVGFAKRFGYGGIEVLNLFAFRATDPADLKQQNFPVGPENDAHIRAVCGMATQVICAWGANVDNPVGKHRVDQVRRLFDELYVQQMVLATTKSGQPSHPLMLSYDRKLVPWVPIR